MNRPLFRLLTLGALGLLYFGLGKFGLSLAFRDANASPVWPPTGVSLAAMLLLGYWVWPAVLVGAFMVNWTTPQTSHAPLVCLAMAAGNTLEALLGAMLTWRFAKGIAAFDRAGDMCRYVLLAAIPSTIVSASIGAGALVAGGVKPWDQFFPIWLTWWTGDLMSDLVVAPILIIWLAKPLQTACRRRLVEAGALLLCVVVLSVVMFGMDFNVHSELYPLTPIGIPLLLWAGFRFHQRGAIGAAGVMAAFAVWGTAKTNGPFWVGGHPNDSLLMLQMFMGTVTLTALFVAAVVAEQEDLLDREKAARAEAQRANQAKDRFLAVLSHELRTPLTPVLLTSSLLEQNADLSDAARADVRTIRRNVELEARLIDDLLDLSRIANGKMSLNVEPVRVHALLDAVQEMVAPDVQTKRQSMQLAAAAQHDHVSADAVRLQQVLWNLLKNAVKFTPEEGQIHIRTCNETNGESEHLTIEFHDTGVGIKPELMPGLFTPFDQGGHETTQRFGGLGLGLAISKAIVEMHGGQIKAHSDGEGRGAKFTITLKTLPIAKIAPPRSTPPAAEAVATTSQIRVLLVEDHDDTLRLLRRLLEAAGFSVASASSVKAALTLIDAQPFDIVVSDIGLGDQTGHHLMRQIRAANSHLPGIALTGYGMDEDINQSRAAGFAAHLTKPVDVSRLASTIRQLSAR